MYPNKPFIVIPGQHRGYMLKVQDCRSSMPDPSRVVTACLEPGPCHCATVVVGAFKNHTQQAQLSTAISSPRQNPVSLGTDNKYIIH